MQADPDVIVVGDVMLDVSVEATALRRGGDVHGRVRVRPGGSGANAAVWAACEGARVRLHGRVGDDLSGQLVRASLADRGAQDELVVDANEPTGSMLIVHEAGERSMVADRGANARVAASDLPDRLEARAVLVSGYLLLHEGSEPAARAALERSVAEWTAVDAASWPLLEAFGPHRFLEATASAGILFANDREAALLSGAGDEQAARRLGERYRAACVKLGDRGAVASWEGSVLWAPAKEIRVIDPTGAGDAFDGAVMAALALGATPEEALRKGCHAGATAASSPDPWPER